MDVPIVFQVHQFKLVLHQVEEVQPEPIMMKMRLKIDSMNKSMIMQHMPIEVKRAHVDNQSETWLKDGRTLHEKHGKNNQFEKEWLNKDFDE